MQLTSFMEELWDQDSCLMDGERQDLPELSPLIIGILGIIGGALIITVYHCISDCWCQRSTLRSMRLSQANRQDEVRPGNSSTMMISIPEVVYGNEYKEGVCSVCLSELKDGERIRVLPACAHLFHVACIDAWLKAQSNCPLCRANVAAPQHVVLSLNGRR